MKKNLRILSALLALCAILPSCGSETASDETTAPDTTDTTPEETTSQFVKDDLPALDFEGETMNVVVGDYNSAYWDDLYVEEATGSRLNDSIYNMRIAVEQRLNVKLNYIREEYNWSGMSDYVAKITSQILAGDDSTDLLFSQNNFAARLSEGKYFADLSNNEYVNLEKPWYNQSVLENMPDGEISFVLGEFSLGNIKNAFVVYFNNDLKETLGIDTDLYKLVDDGKWTIDAMSTLIKDTYSDLNGNAEIDTGDQFGLTFGDFNKYMGFIKALGMDIYKKQSDGRYKLEAGNERGVNVVELIQKLNQSENILMGRNNLNDPTYQVASGGANYVSKPFIDGRALLSCSLIADATFMIPELSFNYGLLPYPKYDEAQENYNSSLQRVMNALIPITARDHDKSGALLEAISSETYRSVVPEYCEVTLKVRYSPDDNVSRMFDIVKDNIVYDPGEIFSDLLGYPTATIRDKGMMTDQSWATTFASVSATWDEKLSQICEVVK